MFCRQAGAACNEAVTLEVLFQLPLLLWLSLLMSVSVSCSSLTNHPLFTRYRCFDFYDVGVAAAFIA